MAAELISEVRCVGNGPEAPTFTLGTRGSAPSNHARPRGARLGGMASRRSNSRRSEEATTRPRPTARGRPGPMSVRGLLAQPHGFRFPVVAAADVADQPPVPPDGDIHPLEAVGVPLVEV